MLNLWKSKITIYSNIISETSERSFRRFVVDKCNIQTQLTEKNNGTVSNIVGIKTVITKSVENFIKQDDFILLPEKTREKYYTVKNGDFVVFEEVTDTVSNALEFAELQKKYKDNGMKVVTVNPHINGMDVDNITLTSV